MTKTKKLFSVNAVVEGFQVKRVYELKKRQMIFYELAHIGTGAKYIHLANKDKNNAFAVAFRTIPHNSTGVAHILEHMVLAGSKKYPVKDPFFSLIKRSLQSFMNAFTSTDWTGYPFASANKKDFYNLLSVYLDAVFAPLLSEKSFLQEGWRLVYRNGNLEYEGVVYNEMKGAMSSPERVLEQEISKRLFPHSTYRFNSGGDPREIPLLSHNDLKEFYKKYYHPSNALFYSYGNFSLQNNLRKINKYLQFFQKNKNIPRIIKEKKWSIPRSARAFYSLSANKKSINKYYASLSWLTAPVKNTEEILSLEILEEVLLGGESGLLRRALIDSGLGRGLVETSGLDTDYSEAVFTCGLSGMRKGSAAKMSRLIRNTLKNIVEKGIDPELWQAALHKKELSIRKISNEPFPYGLNLWLRMINPVFYGGDALETLNIEKYLRFLRPKISAGYLEKQIEKYLLLNKHRLLLSLVPDKNYQNKENARLKKTLISKEKKMKVVDKQKIIDLDKSLSLWQKAEEDLSCLPVLRLDDIDKNIRQTVVRKLSPQMSFYPQNTNGIFDFVLSFKFDSLTSDDVIRLPLLAYILPRLGTKKKDYNTLSRAVESLTAGIDASVVSRWSQGGKKETRNFFYLTTSVLNRNIKPALLLLREILLEYDFSDYERLFKLGGEFLAQMEAGIVSHGHEYALSLAGRGFSLKHYLNEEWHGLHQYFFIKKIFTKYSQSKMKQLAEKMATLAEKIFCQKNLQIGLIGEENHLTLVHREVDGLFAGFKNKRQGKKFKKIKIKRFFEAYEANTTVAFVAAAFMTVSLRHEDAASLFVLSKLLFGQYLHKVIREQGGAYGANARYNMEDGSFYLNSYRDPHIVRTLDVFAHSKAFILSGNFKSAQVEESIIAAIGEIDRPKAPTAVGLTAFWADLIGLSFAERQKFRNRLLKVTKNDVIRVSRKHFPLSEDKYSIAVLANKEMINKANRLLGRKKLQVRDI